MNTTAMHVWHVTRMEKINTMRMQEKRVLVLVLLLASSLVSFAQSETDRLIGEVSYKSSRNIYVKFSSTENITIGDTLFFAAGETPTPAIVVSNKSSISVIGTPFPGVAIEKGTRLITAEPKPELVISPKPVPIQPTPLEEELIEVEADLAQEARDVDTIKKTPNYLKGRITAAAYFNFSENANGNRQRMRYTISLNANRINNSKFSAETYMAFKHTVGEWEEVQQNFKRAFKVYSLAVRYDANESTRFWAGRKTNFSISNIGVIDGLQGEKNWKTMRAGAFVGARPDYADFGLNTRLFQYGVYVGNRIEGKHGQMNNTLAIAEQKNSGKTDRRFIYFQHQNSLLPKVNLFTSFDFDLYTVINGQPMTAFNLTSLYVSLRYRPSRTLSVFGSYDARNNIIYYESYKSTIDRLLEDETRQGYRLSLNYRPLKKVTIGANAGYRFQKDNPSSKNLNTYIRFSSVPGIRAAVTVTALFIESAYLTGTVYGARISRDIVKGKLFGQLELRKVRYRYNNIEIPLDQSILGLNLSWRLTRKLSIALNFEGEFQNRDSSGRVYTYLIKRL